MKEEQDGWGRGRGTGRLRKRIGEVEGGEIGDKRRKKRSKP